MSLSCVPPERSTGMLLPLANRQHVAGMLCRLNDRSHEAMRYAPILVCCSILWSGGSSASNWVKVPDANVGGGVASVDTETFRVQRGVVTFWEKLDYPDGSIDRAHVSIDCNKRTWQGLYVLSTDAHGAKKEEASAPEPLKDIPPDTVIDNLRHEVCLVPELEPYLRKTAPQGRTNQGQHRK